MAPPRAGRDRPPVGSVLIAGTVLGVMTLVAVVYTFRTAARAGSRDRRRQPDPVALITALPAFFVRGVPVRTGGAAAAGVVVTLITVWLVLSKPVPA